MFTVASTPLSHRSLWWLSGVEAIRRNRAALLERIALLRKEIKYLPVIKPVQSVAKRP